jgi:hypothetical protein
LAGGVVGYNSEKGPSKDHFTIVWAHLTQQFQRSFLSDFLSNFLFLVMVDILAGGRGRWTEFMVEWSLGGHLSELCPTTPAANQDGHHY